MTGTDSIGVSGSGAGVQPFRPALRIRPGQQNLIVGHEDGVEVQQRILHPNGTDDLVPEDDGRVRLPAAFLRTSAGEIIAPEADRSVTLPPGGMPVYGDGFTVDGVALVPNVRNSEAGGWPVLDLRGQNLAGDVDDLDDFGSPLFRGDWGLRGLPDHTAISGGGGETLVGDTLVNVVSQYTSPASVVWSITNPSPSRRMIVNRQNLGVVRLSCPVGGLAMVALQARVNGGAYGTIATRRWPVPTSGTQAIQFEGEVTKANSTTIAAGASFSTQLRIVVVREGGGSDAPVFIGAAVATELLGVTV